MGGGASTEMGPGKIGEDELETVVEWKILPSSEEAWKKFTADGTLVKNSDPGHFELRTILDDVYSQKSVGDYAKEMQALDIFSCWVDIQEFKAITSAADDYKRSKALHIYHKYIKEEAPLQVGDIDPKEQEYFKALLETSVDDASVLEPHLFNKVQRKCFLAMYHNIFLPFKQKPEYLLLTAALKKRYNTVKLDDFEYYNKLGEGGFGFVVHAKKKSTGKHYAMKLQTKRGLLDCFSDDPWRADFEKQAFAQCQHPFIVNLDYAFQTDALAIMVLGLATAGDLQKALNKAAEEKLDEDRVRFYVAEMVLALSYLHQLGLMYRDLKPNNVLLHDTGHIMLVDLGGVADENGSTLGKRHEEEHGGVVSLLTQAFAAQKDASSETKSSPTATESGEGKRPKRKLSIMGTFGYMAPEMVVMLSQASYEKTGYTCAVDWWSLGVTMFKLLTGYRPFTDDNFNTFVEMATTMNDLVREHCDSPEYAILFQEIPFPEYISPDARALISRLLDVNDKTRLGSGPNGAKDIKAHPFFKGINWDMLEQKQVEPPFKPDRPKLLEDLVCYPDFATMLEEYGKGDWLKDVPSNKEQQYFSMWDFISPHTLRVESGLSHVMDQYDKKTKVRQLMGAELGGIDPPRGGMSMKKSASKVGLGSARK